ncbi:unnamed protein product [Closterium sp. Naga37s-1]|nr:unnamed protein product [Closterium sp. Naga37s-1]
MALLEGVIAFDRSVASLPWTSREAVTDLFRAQLNGPSADAQLSGQPADGVVSSGATKMTQSLERSGSERDKNNGGTIDSPKDMNGDQVKDGIGKVGSNGGMAGDNEAVVEYWSAQMAGLLEDLRSVRIGGAAEKTGGVKDKSAGHGPKDMRWKPCEQAAEYRTLHRPGPNGTAVHTTCIEGVVHAPADAALAMSCDAPFFKEWWPNVSMPSHRCEESRYIKRVGENFHLSFMRFKVPWPLPPQEFALIFVTVYDAASGMTVTVLRTLPENPATADFTNHGYNREDAPPPLPGHMRMGISGGYAVKDMGERRAHMRCIFTLDLRFPPALVNFIIQQCGGILYQWFTERNMVHIPFPPPSPVSLFPFPPLPLSPSPPLPLSPSPPLPLSPSPPPPLPPSPPPPLPPSPPPPLPPSPPPPLPPSPPPPLPPSPPLPLSPSPPLPLSPSPPLPLSPSPPLPLSPSPPLPLSPSPPLPLSPSPPLPLSPSPPLPLSPSPPLPLSPSPPLPLFPSSPLPLFPSPSPPLPPLPLSPTPPLTLSRQELARIYDDPSSTKGKAFRQALHDEPLYNHVRGAMEKYRAARAAEQQQLEAEQQRKHQELVGDQQNGQAAGERIHLVSKEEEEKSFRELGAEVEARIESLVSRRASSNGSIDVDGVEIVEAGEWGDVEARPGGKGMGVGEVKASGSMKGLQMDGGSRKGGLETGVGAAGGADGGAEGGALESVGTEAGGAISRAAVTAELHKGPKHQKLPLQEPHKSGWGRLRKALAALRKKG